MAGGGGSHKYIYLIILCGLTPNEDKMIFSVWFLVVCLILMFFAGAGE